MWVRLSCLENYQCFCVWWTLSKVVFRCLKVSYYYLELFLLLLFKESLGGDFSFLPINAFSPGSIYAASRYFLIIQSVQSV